MVRRRRQAGRRRRRGRRMKRISNAPPRLSITSNTRRLLLSYGFDVADNAKRVDITYATIFAYGPNTGLPFQYREGKILSAKIYWQSDNATSDAGSVCLNVEDFGENNGTEGCDFHELVAYPGSMVRKVWQNVSNRWFPTEPSDREFRSLLGTDGAFTVTVRHSIAASKLKGRVICMLNMALRGRSVSRCKAAAELLKDLQLREDMDFVTLESPAAKSQ